MISRKICLLGAFAVGKTSLVRRYVHEVFDERYTTTLGVRIDTKTVDLVSGSVKLIIWDMEGADPADKNAEPVSSRMKAYLQGVDGVLLVADGTRPATVEVVSRIHQWFADGYPGIPVALLLNKSDLVERWQVSESIMEDWAGSLQCFTTSALSGTNVERTFHHLAEALSNGL